MLQIFDLILDFFRMDHSPRPNDETEKNEHKHTVRKFSQKRWFFWVPIWLGIRWKIKKMQRIFNAGRAPSSSAELGQQSISLIFELGRPRQSSAELGRSQPSSAQLGRGQPRIPTELGPNKSDIFRSRWQKIESLCFYDLELARCESV